MNQENLVSLADRTTEEQREIARKGGIASGKARKEKKLLKDELAIIMENVNKDGKTYQELISTALVKEALKGNTKAYEIIRDTLGQKPKEEISVSGELNNPYSELSVEELRKLAGD